MKDSFLNSIVSSALIAQDAQESNSASESIATPMSGVSERDGYVGEMVKASLALFEDSTPDLSRKFPSEYVAVINSLEVWVAQTQLDIEFDSDFCDSIQDLLDKISDIASLDFSEPEIFYSSDKKVHILDSSPYGKVHAIVGLELYQTIDTNSILKLPVRSIS